MQRMKSTLTTSSVKRESVLQRAVIKRLKEHGAYVVNVHGSAFNSRGTPDLIVCLDGAFLGLELKVGKNKPEPAQLWHGNRIKQSGGQWYCIRSLEELERVLRHDKDV